MDALSTHPLSSLLLKSFISTNPNNNNHPLHLLKPTPPSTSSTNPTLPPLSTTLSNKANYQSLALSASKPLSLPPPSKPTVQTHRKAATGYAAALLDAACCDGALGVTARDVRRVKRVVGLVLEDERVEGGKKGEVVRRVVEGGGFYGKLVVLVRMLVAKGKVGVVEEVLEEFGKLWEELCGVEFERVLVVKGKKRNLVFEAC